MKKNNLLYLQIVDDYKKYIELGVYKYNDRLPSVRSLAVEMGINPNTIQRAYQILESQGYITTIEKKGVYVCYKKDDDKALIKDKIKKDIITYKKSNLTKKELIEIIEEVYND
ncbi:MAG: GntR family transcriptional regulator [Bacilli bacterium]|nr:GntR family transcriptional regulator [Bacilli bacterium]